MLSRETFASIKLSFRKMASIPCPNELNETGRNDAIERKLNFLWRVSFIMCFPL